MRNFSDTTSKIVLSKDLIVEQTNYHLHTKFNTSGLGFDASEGFGDNTVDTSLWLFGVGGFPDQKITADLKYVSPTSTGSEDLGIILRVLTVDSPHASYYYARMDQGVAKIVKVVNGSFTTLTSGVFTPAQDEVITVVFEAVGTQLSASFSGPSAGTINLSATDSDITEGGVFGARSSSCTIFCRNVLIEQL